MITYIIIALLFLLYFGIGAWIFAIAVDQIGGKESYKSEISEADPRVSSAFAYRIAQFLVIFFWPYFMIKGAKNGKGETKS